MNAKCTEVWIRFRDNRNGQHITMGDGPTYAQKLGVRDDGKRFSILFWDGNGKVCKIIGWPIDVIHEYALEGVSEATD